MPFYYLRKSIFKNYEKTQPTNCINPDAFPFMVMQFKAGKNGDQDERISYFL
jgi:hypothetical protein